MDVATLIQEIKSLDGQDRRKVMEALGEPPDDFDLEEFNRRVELFEKGTLETDPWELVKERWTAGSQ